MTHANATPKMKRRVLYTATAILLALLTMFITQPANAHDYVQSTSPEAAETVNRSLETVAITFSQPPLSDLDGSSLIEVTSEEGEKVSADTVTIDGATISTAVTFAGPGTYTVAWKSVSSDGHAISETYDFVWASNGPPSSTEPAVPAPTASPSESAASATPTEAPQSGAATADNSLPLVIVLVVVILVLLAVVIIAIYRPRNKGQKKTQGDAQ